MRMHMAGTERGPRIRSQHDETITFKAAGVVLSTITGPADVASFSTLRHSPHNYERERERERTSQPFDERQRLLEFGRRLFHECRHDG